jgi:hypothetical protein
MTVAHIKPAEVETFSLDWGTMKWFVSPVTIPGAANSQGEVIVNPGQGHARHLHERADELHPGRRGAGADRAARLHPAPGRRDRQLGTCHPGPRVRHS